MYDSQIQRRHPAALAVRTHLEQINLVDGLANVLWLEHFAARQLRIHLRLLSEVGDEELLRKGGKRRRQSGRGGLLTVAFPISMMDSFRSVPSSSSAMIIFRTRLYGSLRLTSSSS